MLSAKAIMTKDVVSVGLNAKLTRVVNLMLTHEIRHIPVVSGGEIKGIISEGDILLHCHLSKGKMVVPSIPAKEVMTKDPVVCSRDTPVKEIANTFVYLQIDSIPVVENRKLKGIITSSDVLDRFCLEEELSGHGVMPLAFVANRKIKLAATRGSYG